MPADGNLNVLGAFKTNKTLGLLAYAVFSGLALFSYLSMNNRKTK